MVALKMSVSEIEHLRTENARLREALEWRPIETAPRDGTSMLLYPSVYLGLPCGIGHYVTRRESWQEGPYTEVRPTHWRPLPEPPSDTPAPKEDTE